MVQRHTCCFYYYLLTAGTASKRESPMELTQSLSLSPRQKLAKPPNDYIARLLERRQWVHSSSFRWLKRRRRVWAQSRFNLNGNTICMQDRTRAGRVQAGQTRKTASGEKEEKKATMRRTAANDRRWGRRLTIVACPMACWVVRQLVSKLLCHLQWCLSTGYRQASLTNTQRRRAGLCVTTIRSQELLSLSKWEDANWTLPFDE